MNVYDYFLQLEQGLEKRTGEEGSNFYPVDKNSWSPFPELTLNNLIS